MDLVLFRLPGIVCDWVPTLDSVSLLRTFSFGHRRRLMWESFGDQDPKVEDIIDGKHAAAVWLGHNGHTIWLCDGYLPYLYQTTSKQGWLGLVKVGWN